MRAIDIDIPLDFRLDSSHNSSFLIANAGVNGYYQMPLKYS